jgi:hypothetical protein
MLRLIDLDNLNFALVRMYHINKEVGDFLYKDIEAFIA